MTCDAHTAYQPWRRPRRARDTSPATPDIDRATLGTLRAPRALSCTYTFDPVHMQKESVRSDQTRAHNDAGTSPSLTGQGIHVFATWPMAYGAP
jgi:hypothetical protein